MLEIRRRKEENQEDGAEKRHETFINIDATVIETIATVIVTFATAYFGAKLGGGSNQIGT